MRCLSIMLLPANAGDVTSMAKCPPPPFTSAREPGIFRSMASRSASMTEPWKSVGCNGRVAVEPKQVFLPGRIERARRGNPGDDALVFGPDVEDNDLAPIEHGL